MRCVINRGMKTIQFSHYKCADLHCCTYLSLQWFLCLTMCRHLSDHLTSNTGLDCQHVKSPQTFICTCFIFTAGQFYSVQRCREASEHQVYNTHTHTPFLLNAAFTLIISQAVCLCPLLAANAHITSTLTVKRLISQALL